MTRMSGVGEEVYFYSKSDCFYGLVSCIEIPLFDVTRGPNKIYFAFLGELSGIDDMDSLDTSIIYLGRGVVTCEEIRWNLKYLNRSMRPVRVNDF